jgi:serine/threonine protein kinase
MTSRFSAAKIPTLPRISVRDLEQQIIIGEGSFGRVYAGVWKALPVAIKVLKYQLLTTDEKTAFEKEVDLLWTCQKPGVVKFLGVCNDPGYCAMVFEQMHRSLYQLLHESGTSTPEEQITQPQRLQIARDIAEGMKNLHELRVVHGDLKSANILLTKHLRAKITDFGLSRVREASKSKSTLAPGQSPGTISWSAPEIFKGRKVSEASDMYSFGVILWELQAYMIPYDGWKLEAIMFQVLIESKNEPIPESCPSEWRRLITNCWNREPDQRPGAKEAFELFKSLIPAQRFVWQPVTELPCDGYTLRSEGYVSYPAGPQDWDIVLNCYNRRPAPGYEIESVEVIFNPQMDRIFAEKRFLLEQRHGNDMYSPLWRQQSDSLFREGILNIFETAAEPYIENSFPHVNIMPLWHGTQRARLRSLLSTGYGNFATSTDGEESYYGAGVYATLDAQYANFYANLRSDRQTEEPVLILNWGITYSSYPVLMEDFDVAAKKLKGRIERARYDSHVVLVIPNPANPTEYIPASLPTTSLEDDFYTEVVVFDQSHLLPKYIVTLKPSVRIETDSAAVDTDSVTAITAQKSADGSVVQVLVDYHRQDDTFDTEHKQVIAVNICMYSCFLSSAVIVAVSALSVAFAQSRRRCRWRSPRNSRRIDCISIISYVQLPLCHWRPLCTG